MLRGIAYANIYIAGESSIKPRMVHFSFSDQLGGANIAAWGMHQALLSNGFESQMFVGRKVTDDPTVHEVPLLGPWRRRFVKLSRLLERQSTTEFPGTFAFQDRTYFDLDWLKRRLASTEQAYMVHWTAGFLSLRDLRRFLIPGGSACFFVGMDQEPGTGGCHYPGTCREYRRACAHCPVLPVALRKCATSGLAEKAAFWKAHQCYYLSSSSGAYEFAKNSQVLKHGTHIYSSLPLTVPVRNETQEQVRTAMGIPQSNFVVLCAGYPDHVWRKGTKDLRTALSLFLRDVERNSITVLVVGSPGPGFANEVGCNPVFMGHVGKDRLSMAYRCADVFVCSSIEDEGPMMISEAMLHGLPVVSYLTGKAPDLILEGVTGFLVKEKTPDQLAIALHSFYRVANKAAMGKAAQEHAAMIHSPVQFASIIRKALKLNLI